MDKDVTARVLGMLTGQGACPADELCAEIHCTIGDLMELAIACLVQFHTTLSDQVCLTITPEGAVFLKRLG